jgi:WD40 repeat protein
MRSTLVALTALVAVPAFAAEPPLPEGATARLGTTQFRTSGHGLVLSPDGRRAALRVPDGIEIMDLESGRVVARMSDAKRLPLPRPGRGDRPYGYAFAAGGKELVTTGPGTEVWVWDAATGKPLRSVAAPKQGDGKPATVTTLHNCQLGDFAVAETTAGWHKFNAKAGTWTAISGGYDKISDVSPDGRWVTDYTDMASVENYVGVTDTKDNIGVFSGESGGAYPFSSTPSPSGKYVACTTSEAGPEVWEVATKKVIKLEGVKPKGDYGSPMFTPNSKVLMVLVPSSVYDERTPPHLARWDVTTGKQLPDVMLPGRPASLAIDHKNNRLLVVAGDCVFRIDIATGKLTAPPEGFTGRARPAISADGKFVAVGDAAGVIRVWDSPFTGKPRTLRGKGSPIHDLLFAADGKTLFAGHEDRTATAWDAATGKQVEVFNPPAENIRGRYYSRPTKLALSPDGKTLICEVETERMWAWDVPSRRVLWELKADEKGEGVTGCRPAFTPDGTAMYYGLPKAEVAKLDPRTGKELERFAVPAKLKSWVVRLAVSPDGKRLAAQAYYNNSDLVIFEPGKGEPIWRQSFDLAEALGGLLFTPDGSAVLTTHPDGSIRAWKAATGERSWTLRGPAGYVVRLQVTPGGKLAVTDAPGATALVWKLK